MLHELKTWPIPFQAVWDGRKTAEFRRADRPYAEGDAMKLQEYDPETKTYSGRDICTTITHVVRGGAFGIPPDHAMLSFKLLERVESEEDMQ